MENSKLTTLMGRAFLEAESVPNSRLQLKRWKWHEREGEGSLLPPRLQFTSLWARQLRRGAINNYRP